MESDTRLRLTAWCAVPRAAADEPEWETDWIDIGGEG